MKTMESPKIPFLELDLPILNKKKREVAQSLNTMAKISYSPSCLKTCAWWLYFQATILFLFRPLDIGNLLTSFFLVHLSLFFCCCFRPLELWMPHSSPAQTQTQYIKRPRNSTENSQKSNQLYIGGPALLVNDMGKIRNSQAVCKFICSNEFPNQYWI